MLNRIVFVVSLCMASISTPAFAEKQQASKQTAGDPNEKICETIKPVGSRLATKRFCGTRAEWEDRKMQDRQALEKAQLGPCVVNGTTCK